MRRRQSGYLLVTVIITLFLVASVAVLLAHDSANSANTSNREMEAARVDYVTQAGLQHSLWQAQNSACMGDVTIPDTALGNDKYSATVKAAAAGTLVTLSADQDAWIRSDDVSRNNGTTTWNHVRNEVAGTEQILTRFDLSSLAANAQVSSAVAWFHVKALTPHPEGSITIHEITADWAETAVTWESFAGAYGSSKIGMIPAQDTGDVWVGINLTAQVQAWVNGQPNYGILFNPQADGTHTEYTAREDGTNPPRLEVVIGSGQSSPVSINVEGTLDSGIVRNLNSRSARAFQPPSITTLQLGTDPGMDAILDSFYERNYGGANYLQINNDGSWTQRPVLRFELATVPQGAKVVSAQLELRRLSVNSPGSATVHRLTQSFVGGTKAGGGVADGATWATYDGINNWSSAGGDYDAAVVAKTYIDGSEDWVSWDIGPLVDAWVNGEPNNGLLIDGANGLKQAKFASQEDGDPAVRPKLTITYACECGSACLSPKGSGNVVMVVINPTTLVPADAYKKALFESWGYTVDVISESANQAEYDAKAASGDVFFISETVNSNQVGNKLVDVPIGVVSQDGSYNSDLGLAGGSAWPVSPTINVTDTSHFITAVFPAGPLDIYSGAMEQLAVSGGAAAGLQTLADTGGAGSLVALDTGATLLGSGSAAGRRVMLPLGREGRMNWDYLNGNGRLVVQRSLAWAMKADGGVTGKNVLLVVADAVNLPAQDAAKQTLIEGWGHTVNLIDDDAAQTEFDAAYAVNDVVYVSEEILTGAISTKLRNAYIGVVFEEQKIPDELGVSSGESVYFETSIDITDNTHYITETFNTGALTIVSSSQEVGALGGTLAPDLQILAQHPSSTTPTLAVIEKGGALFDGGTAEGRRVKVPWGGNAFDINALTADGQTIMKRAIEWGSAENSLAPIAHWKLDETSGTSALDSAGGHDGTLKSGPVWTPGQLGGGLQFNGASDYVEVAHATSLWLTGEMTFSAWANTLDTSGGYKAIVAKDTPGNGASNFWFGIDNDELVFGFWASSAFRSVKTPAANLGPGEWHHLAATFDNNTDVVKLYVDGSEQYVGSISVEPTTETADLWIGRSVDGEYWDGLLDDVRIYDRTLSASEIAELATPSTAGPIAHWKLDETSGTTAVDSIGGNNGQLNGSGSWGAGEIDGGLALDYSNGEDYVEIPNSAGLENVQEGSYTLSAWFRPDSTPPGINGDNDANYGILIKRGWHTGMFFNNQNRFGFWQHLDGNINIASTSGTAFSPGSFYHVAATVDRAAGLQSLYVNGQLEDTSSFTPGAAAREYGTEMWRIGIASPNAPDWGWAADGAIDDVRIFDQVLSLAEIADLYAGGGGGGGGGGEPEPAVLVFLSTDTDATFGGATFGDDDLAAYDINADSAAVHLDGAVFSRTDEDINAVHILPSGELVLSTTGNASLGGLSFGDDDLVLYNPGTDVATLLLDGSIFSNSTEDIDAVYLLAPNRYLLSTETDAQVAGLSVGDDDLFVYDADRGQATLYFDGALFSASDEDVNAVHVLSNGHLLISTAGNATLGGLSFEDDDIIDYDPTTDTASIYLDGSIFSSTDEDIDAITLAE